MENSIPILLGERRHSTRCNRICFIIFRILLCAIIESAWHLRIANGVKCAILRFHSFNKPIENKFTFTKQKSATKF